MILYSDVKITFCWYCLFDRSLVRLLLFVCTSVCLLSVCSFCLFVDFYFLIRLLICL